jgi:transposase
MKRKTKIGSRKKNTLNAQNSGLKVRNSGKRTSRKKKSSPSGRRRSLKRRAGDAELLEMLIKKIIEKLEKNSCEAKVQDALRAIQLKQKLAKNWGAGFSSGGSPVGEAEKSFWEMIDQIRKEELSKLCP